MFDQTSEPLTLPLKIEVSGATQIAIDSLKAVGGEVIIKYRTPLKLREHISPEKFRLPLKEPIPGAKEVYRLEKYRSKGSQKLIARCYCRVQSTNMGTKVTG